MGSKRAYLINDREYQINDGEQLKHANRLRDVGFDAKLDVVNLAKNPYLDDDAGEATEATVSAAVDQDVDLISYYGHGAAAGWGYLLNILTDDVHFHAGSVIPLTFSMACETARNAPNPPWYPYLDSDGVYEAITAPPFVPADEIPQPSNTQPALLMNGSMASRFTSEEAGGAMVYIGETVVTSAEPNLLSGFYDAVVNAYIEPTTIGDIWARVEGNGTPEYWQFVGDPSTWFIF
jgi:hypothetical protein